MPEHARIQKGWGDWGPDTPLENNKAVWFLRNTGMYPLEFHKALQPTFSIWSLSAQQRNAI